MKEKTMSFVTLLVHWSSFGPFHIARLNTAFNDLKSTGVTVVGMEMTSQKEIFGWKQDNGPTSFNRYVVLPGQVFERVSPLKMMRGVISILDRVNPHAVAINGYSYYDSWSALAWCKLHRRPAILMSDSKSDDAPRVAWKEWLKRRIVQQFDSALCAGESSRNYLEQLGIKTEKIFEGLDAIDNDFFWRVAEQARQNPAAYRSLPGLELPEPFFLASGRFVKGKNLDGLLRAYAQYHRRVCETGKRQMPWRLVILGDGPERSALEYLVHSKGIQGVSFAGFCQIDKLPIYHALASVFIHPTYQDTWGLVVNEAMAAGVPVLVSKRAGCSPDLVCEGENGFTFFPEDTETLADLMVFISSGQVDLKAMSQASRDHIRAWGLKRFAQGLYGALQAAIQRQGSTVRLSRQVI
jgi:1,2-diacylglycerol 3-alpha-glucosyltransferase